MFVFLKQIPLSRSQSHQQHTINLLLQIRPNRQILVLTVINKTLITHIVIRACISNRYFVSFSTLFYRVALSTTTPTTWVLRGSASSYYSTGAATCSTYLSTTDGTLGSPGLSCKWTSITVPYYKLRVNNLSLAISSFVYTGIILSLFYSINLKIQSMKSGQNNYFFYCGAYFNIFFSRDVFPATHQWTQILMMMTSVIEVVVVALTVEDRMIEIGDFDPDNVEPITPEGRATTQGIGITRQVRVRHKCRIHRHHLPLVPQPHQTMSNKWPWPTIQILER